MHTVKEDGLTDQAPEKRDHNVPIDGNVADAPLRVLLRIPPGEMLLNARFDGGTEIVLGPLYEERFIDEPGYRCFVGNLGDWTRTVKSVIAKGDALSFLVHRDSDGSLRFPVYGPDLDRSFVVFLTEAVIANNGFASITEHVVSVVSRRTREAIDQAEADEEAEWARIVASEENQLDDEEELLDQLLDKLEHNVPVDSNAVRDFMHRVGAHVRPPAAVKAEGPVPATEVAALGSPQGGSAPNSTEAANDYAI